MLWWHYLQPLSDLFYISLPGDSKEYTGVQTSQVKRDYFENNTFVNPQALPDPLPPRPLSSVHNKPVLISPIVAPLEQR